MKIYGWDDVGVQRGDLVAANVPGRDVDFFGIDALASELGWECAFPTFKEARTAILEQMRQDGVDDELIRCVRGMKAQDLPVLLLEN